MRERPLRETIVELVENVYRGFTEKEDNVMGNVMENVERAAKFLKDAETYYLATAEGDQPRVRPFGTAHVYEGRLYIQTGKVKDVSRQILANPKVEICAFNGDEWIRIAGSLVEDDRVEARASMLDAYPDLRAMYNENDGLPPAAFPPCGIPGFRSGNHHRSPSPVDRGERKLVHTARRIRIPADASDSPRGTPEKELL